MRFRINSYNYGNAVQTLKTAIATALDDRVLRLRPDTTFAPRSGDFILNYGDSNCRFRNGNGVTVFNEGEAVGRSTNKQTFFRHLGQHNVTHAAGTAQHVPLVENTFDRDVANRWIREGATVFARTVLQGHSGDGIVVCAQERPADLGQVEYAATAPQARLYTKAVTGARREYRIHVFRGQVILVQKKQRRSGWRENANYSDTVRNLDGGWVFGVSTANPSDEVRRAAVNAVETLGLDFGAVDVVAKGSQGREAEVFVLEVNTAPGQGGDTTTERYVEAIRAAVRGETYAPYGAAAPRAAAPTGEAPLTAQVAQAASENRRAEQAEQAPTVNSAAPTPSPAQSRTRRSASYSDNTVYMVDVSNGGDRDQLAKFMNGGFYLFGEEVPVNVTNVRETRISLRQ